LRERKISESPSQWSDATRDFISNETIVSGHFDLVMPCHQGSKKRGEEWEHMPEPICLAVLRLITNSHSWHSRLFRRMRERNRGEKESRQHKTAADMNMNSHLANSDLPRTRRFTSSYGLNNQKMTERQSGMLLCQRNVKKELRKRKLKCWTLTATGSIAFNIRESRGKTSGNRKNPSNRSPTYLFSMPSIL
jgi:hypothetical protein